MQNASPLKSQKPGLNQQEKAKHKLAGYIFLYWHWIWRTSSILEISKAPEEASFTYCIAVFS